MIEDHPLRYALANELHARPFPMLASPCTVVYLAIKQPKDAATRERDKDQAHLAALLERYGAPLPRAGATHYSGQIGRHQLKWEQHTEFISYTACSDGVSSRPFDAKDFEIFPEDWLNAAPGKRVTSIMLRIETVSDVREIIPKLPEWFDSESVAATCIPPGTNIAVGDFRIDPAGHMRFAVGVEDALDSSEIARIVQNLCEIETYKAMSMLGFSRVQSLSPQIGVLDANLTELMGQMTADEGASDATLNKLLAISVELEAMAAKSAFRLAATRAYEALVNQRITALRETRFESFQTIGEFMVRRYQPAMRTVRSTERRIAVLSNRAMRASELLRTRVDVERSAQNQEVLRSMDRRADLQLQLQRTVEGLSVVAISYYAVSLAGYLLQPLVGASGFSAGGLTALITVPIVLVVWWLVRRIRLRIE
ncbi:MAG: DUF3422 domain-containing protein [Aestuariivita sp.]|nr:DUF3422 domain-containing protein [Aestuariivita sp.]MCY4201168.1 DUF3422 domain-containing protein [Aestuariivita sp.]